MTTPSQADIASIKAIDDVWKWAGVGDASVKAFNDTAGAVNLIRELATVGESDYEGILTLLRTIQGTATTPKISLLEATRFRLARKCAMVCVWLNPDPPTNVAAPTGASAAPAASPSAPTSTGIKLNKVLDQANDSEVVKLESRVIRKHLADYKLKRGDLPHPDHAPSPDQISAMTQLLAQDAIPYCDFAIFGPHGSRSAKKLSHFGFLQQPDGAWIRQEIPGPGDYDQWWRSFRVFKTLMVMLDVIDVEHVDNYAEHIRSFSQLYGQKAWWIVYQGDVRMRSEYIDRLRTDSEARHAHYASISAEVAQLSDHDHARPWNAVFKQAISDTTASFWKAEVETKSMMYLTSLQSGAAAADDGTAIQRHQDGTPMMVRPPRIADPSGQPPPPRVPVLPPPHPGAWQAQDDWSNNKGNARQDKKRRAAAEGHPKFDSASGEYYTNSSGTELCRKYASGECRGNSCPSQRAHQCSKCLQTGHTSATCSNPRAPGGKGGGKSGKKGRKGGKGK
jgi:hypothetical protein